MAVFIWSLIGGILGVGAYHVFAKKRRDARNAAEKRDEDDT